MTRAVNIAQSGANNVTMRNKIINGAMMIDQRNAGASVTVNTDAVFTWSVDRWSGLGQLTDGVFTMQQSTDAPAGNVNSLKITTTTADASIGSGQYYSVGQAIEGLNVADLGWGAAGASSVTISFWVKSSLTGTFGGSLRNSAADRSYPFSYTINAANTWEQKSVTIAGDTSGTWLKNNGIGIRVNFSMGDGSTRLGPAGTWASGNLAGATGQVNPISTLNATWFVAGVQLEAGTTATPFEQRLYGTELALCQRYYEKSYDIDTAPGASTSAGLVDVTVASNSGAATYQIKYAVTKRANPTLTGYRTNGTSGQWTYERSGVGATGATVSFGAGGLSGCYAAVSPGAAWVPTEIYGHWVASAEL